MSKESNLIYLFITQTPEGEIKTQFLQEFESRVLMITGSYYKPRQ